MKNFSKFLSNNLFEFENRPCECQKETIFDSPGQAPHFKLKVCSISDKDNIKFSYSPQKGLNQSGNAGGLISENILGQLLALPHNDIDAVIPFLEKYGFLFPISDEQYEAIDDGLLMSVIDRIRATVLLMSAIAGKHDYTRMLICTTYLLYSAPIELNLTSSTSYSTKNTHRFTDLIRNYNLLPNTRMSQEVFETEYMTVWDRVTNTREKIDNEDIARFALGDGLCGLPGSTDLYFRNLFCLYSNYAVDDDILRTTIDFYYNYQKKVGVIKDITVNMISHHSSPKHENFSDEMKAALLKIAKATLSDEINANLQGISPQFNPDTLSPSWRLNTLLEALYFSVFYMKPGFELYKECANPNCKREKFFLINATVTNKKYCCPACANATAQRRSRQRKMNQ